MILILIVVVVVIVLPALYVLAQYNALVALRNYIRESWSDVDVELKRRYDLIPNLVAVVKGYAAHERGVFERVTELRNRCAANNGPVADQSRDEVQLVDALKQLLVVVENYPAAQGRPEFSQAANGTRQHRGPHPGRAPVLQRQRARLPQQMRNLPKQPCGDDIRFQIGGRLFQRAAVGPGCAERGFRHVVTDILSVGRASPRAGILGVRGHVRAFKAATRRRTPKHRRRDLFHLVLTGAGPILRQK